MADQFCAICEGKLTRKDSDHVCRACFRKAREPKQVLQLSDKGAQQLGVAVAFGSLINLGLTALLQNPGITREEPVRTNKEARKQILKRLAEFRRKFKPAPKRKRRGTWEK